MSISRQNLTIVIVTFKSEEVIHDCINSIDNGIKINVPPFVESGDKIILDTRTLEYVKKVN